MVRAWRSARWTVLLLIPLATAACASTYQRPDGIRYERYRISAEEIELERSRVNNLHVLIERLRPHWFDAGPALGSSQVVVYEGQSYLGGTSVLANLAPDYALWLEYLDRSQATARLSGLGSRHISGAIVIHHRPR